MANKKTQEICYQLLIKKSFQDEIAKLRKELGISPNGISSIKEVDYWFKNFKRGTKKYLLLEEKIYKIIEKFSGDSIFDDQGLFDFIYYYIPEGWEGAKRMIEVFGEMKQFYGGKILNSDCIIKGRIRKYFKENLECGGFILYIEPYTTKDEAKALIDRIWAIKKDKKLLINFPRIRERKKKERDDLIFNLWQKSKKELDKLDKECNPEYTLSAKYKEGVIRRILQHKYKINISEDNIRKIASIQKKLRDS